MQQKIPEWARRIGAKLNTQTSGCTGEPLPPDIDQRLRRLREQELLDGQTGEPDRSPKEESGVK